MRKKSEFVDNYAKVKYAEESGIIHMGWLKCDDGVLEIPDNIRTLSTTSIGTKIRKIIPHNNLRHLAIIDQEEIEGFDIEGNLLESLKIEDTNIKELSIPETHHDICLRLDMDIRVSGAIDNITIRYE